MGTILIVNPGSSSKKYALYQDGVALLTMRFERVGEQFSQCVERNQERQTCNDIDANTYGNAVATMLKEAVSAGCIAAAEDVTAIGVRVVAPGTALQSHARITLGLLEKLHLRIPYAPLHIPPVLEELEALEQILPAVTKIAVSDSAFHATMPPVARTYSIPAEDARTHDIYRFGYHGLSVSSVVRQLPALIQEETARTIVCHIGSGVSVTAVRDGKSVDTTMGFAPGSGLVMGSRAGDVDSGALLALMEHTGWKPAEALSYLATQGGLRGLTGAADLRIVMERRANHDPAGNLAVELFATHIKKTIGAYIALLGGCDVIALTGTAAERNSDIRDLCLGTLAAVGVVLSPDRNEAVVQRAGIISHKHSPITVAVCPTDEMGEMALVVEQLVSE